MPKQSTACLIISDDDILQKKLKEEGCTTTRYSTKTAVQKANEIATMLKSDKFQLLWCELPRAARRSSATSDLSVAVKTFLTTADEASVPAICVGHHNANWHKINKGPWTKSTHHMCALPAKFGNQAEPSSVIYHAYSNKMKVDTNRCSCPSKTKHVFDLPPCRDDSDQEQKRDSDDQQEARRISALHTLYDHMLPDHSQAFPTEARNAEKARLAAGHIPKKRVKFVEEQFDDLGDDLKGLDPNIHLLALDSRREEIESSDDDSASPDQSWLLADNTADLTHVYKTDSMSDMQTYHRSEVRIYLTSLDQTRVMIRSQPTDENNFPIQTTLDMTDQANATQLAAWCKGAKVAQLSARYQQHLEGSVAQSTCQKVYEAAIKKGISADCATLDAPHYLTWCEFGEPNETLSSYPTIGTDTVDDWDIEDPGPPLGLTKGRKDCPGCSESKPKAHASHTRYIGCIGHRVKPEKQWTCPACHPVQQGVWCPDHTWHRKDPQRCRMTTLDHSPDVLDRIIRFQDVTAAEDKRESRRVRNLQKAHDHINRTTSEKTKHLRSNYPRDPREPAHLDATSDLHPGQLHKRKYPESEPDTPEHLEQPPTDHRPGSSNDHLNLPKLLEGEEIQVPDSDSPSAHQRADDAPLEEAEGEDSDGGSPSASSEGEDDEPHHPKRYRGQRGKDKQRRKRRQDFIKRIQMIDRGTACPADWRDFDVKDSIRNLGSADASNIQIVLELRKLHIRWWHATRTSMEKILKAAGIKPSIIALVPRIIDTCRQCRAYQRPGPHPKTTTTLATDINEIVEADIMFYNDFMIWHMVDRADRWQAGVILPSKNAQDVINAIETCWCSLWGPPKRLVADGERALISQEVTEYLARKGITYTPKAPHQHAQIAERRGQILRAQMHVIAAQAEREEISYSPEMLVSEAIYSGNALICHNGASPYQARVGLTPHCLPNTLQQPNGFESQPGARESIRRIALEKILESTATSRIQRARKTKSSVPGERLDYQPGEEVEIYTKKPHKETIAWEGPFRVIENRPERGQVLVQGKTHEMVRTYNHVRRPMPRHLIVHDADPPESASITALRVIDDFAKGMTVGTTTHLGYALQESVWHYTPSTQKHLNIAKAADFVGQNYFRLADVIAVRISIGVSQLSQIPLAQSSVLVWWTTDPQDIQWSSTIASPAIHMPTTVGTQWKSVVSMQFVSAKLPDT